MDLWAYLSGIRKEAQGAYKKNLPRRHSLSIAHSVRRSTREKMKSAPLLLLVVVAVVASLAEGAPSPPSRSQVESIPAEKHTGGAKEKRGALVLGSYGGYPAYYPSYYHYSYSYPYSYPYAYTYPYGYHPSYYYYG
ncbi:uncharacterized protein LOC135943657 [Cloeon dipterum]|uniref:uncharacterized protein LOC135943657 n=1 Tax=Cloeon dipterum TaxID=197152 RepID=UPI00321FBA12